MSGSGGGNEDTRLSQGWWLASDGKWYPPEQAPEAAPPPPPPARPIAMQLQKPKKKLTRRPLFWILLVIVLFVGGCSAIVIGAGTAVDHSAHQTHSITYSVTGSGTSEASTVTCATVQEGNGQKGESQANNAPLPWSKTITASGVFTEFTVSAQNAGSGSVTCTITEVGTVPNTNTATGQFAIATCTATERADYLRRELVQPP